MKESSAKRKEVRNLKFMSRSFSETLSTAPK